MIYNTTITGGSGNVWTDAQGKQLISVGGQNIFVGKNVWTDGIVIYGYDLPGYISKKIRIKKQLPDVITFVDNNTVEWLEYKNYAESGNDDFEYGSSEISGDIYVSGEHLYYFNNGVIGDTDGHSVMADIYLPNDKVEDIGKNGGMLIRRGDAYFDLFYVSPAFVVSKISHVKIVEMCASLGDWPEDLVDDLSVNYYDCCFYNVGDDGEAAVVVSIGFEGWYRHYTLKVDKDGNWTLGQFQIPKLGDGIARFTITKTFPGKGMREDLPYSTKISETGSIEMPNGTLISIPSNEYKATVVGDFFFVFPAAYKYDISDRYKMLQYDKNGNMLKDYSSTAHMATVYHFNNYRMTACNGEKQFAKWGFVK